MYTYEPKLAAESPLLKTWLLEMPPPLDEHRETLAGYYLCIY